ncbi:MAG: VanW family protein [Eubacteriales bacterium]|nr:VanW family protein [Eubacteriales bacterium]
MRGWKTKTGFAAALLLMGAVMMAQPPLQTQAAVRKQTESAVGVKAGGSSTGLTGSEKEQETEETVLAVMMYSYSDHAGTNRNVQRACNAIDGITVSPGTVFSYNNTLGRRTKENGYVMAPSYAGAETEETIGGGICRISTALYNTALRSNMTILERHPHTKEVDYSRGGLDAAVTDGVQDFRFRNDLTVSVTIHAQYDEYGYVVWMTAQEEDAGERRYDPWSEKIEDGWYRAYLSIYENGKLAYTRSLGESYYWGSRMENRSVAEKENQRG